jgi:hypothetical protein
VSLYRWEHEDPRRPATDGLPTEAVAALDALMDAVVFDPMDYARTPNEPVGKNVRHLAYPAAAARSASSSTSLTCWSWCSA